MSRLQLLYESYWLFMSEPWESERAQADNRVTRRLYARLIECEIGGAA